MAPVGELPQPPERVIRRTGRERGNLFLAFFCLPHTLVGLGVLLAALIQLDLLVWGTDVAGNSLRAERYVSNRRTVSYTLHWTYRHAGETFTREDEIGEEAYARVASAPRSVTGRARGGSAVLTGAWGHPWWNLLKIGGFALVWNGAVGAVLWTSLGRRVQDRWLLRHGLAVPASVQKVVVPGKKDDSAVVHYAFDHPVQGVRTEARVALGVQPPGGLPAAGTEVVALVHPKYAWLSTLLLATGHEIGSASWGPASPSAL